MAGERDLLATRYVSIEEAIEMGYTTREEVDDALRAVARRTVHVLHYWPATSPPEDGPETVAAYSTAEGAAAGEAAHREMLRLARLGVPGDYYDVTEVNLDPLPGTRVDH